MTCVSLLTWLFRLKTQGEISKKHAIEKYFSFDETCWLWAL